MDPEKLYKETSEIVKQKREQFKSLKPKLIEEWEIRTGKEWPKYEKDVIITLKDGTKMIIKKVGDLYDAHHILPLSWGGENVWQNITPLHVSIHFDHRGVHAVDSVFKQLSDYLGGLL